MKKRLLSLVLAALLVCLALGGCASGPKRMDYDYSLLSVSAPARAEGQFLTIIANENLSTKYVWKCEQVSGKLEPVYEAFVSDAGKQTTYEYLPMFCKDNGVHIWQFRGKKACEAEFRLTQINADTGGEIKSETVYATVDRKGNVRWKS